MLGMSVAKLELFQYRLLLDQSHPTGFVPASNRSNEASLT